MGLILLLAVFFFINPLLTIGLGLVFVAFSGQNVSMYTKRESLWLLKALCVMSVLYLSCINSQKIPESDLFVYMRQYHYASETSLLRYLSDFHFKEPVFYGLTWLLNRMLFDSEVWYKFVVSVLCYAFLNVAVYKFCKVLRASIRLTTFALFVLNFTPYIFTSSMHLLRQYLAGAILMYVLVEVLFYQKKNVLLIVSMAFIHSTTFFFIPFLFMKQLKMPFRKHLSMYLLPFVLLFSIQLLTSFLNSLTFFNQSVLGYVLNKASKDTTFDLGEMPILGIALLLLLLCLSGYIAYGMIDRFNTVRGGMKHFFNILIILCLFILFNLDQSELANRFLFFTYFFIPFLAVVLLKNARLNSAAYLIPVPFLVLFWIYYLDQGTWTYAHAEDVWIRPFFSYFLNG